MHNKANILVVDDTPSNLELLRSLLEHYDYEVQTVASGASALAAAEAQLPDLILLDVDMPHMNGYAVCAALKNAPETRDIPVIFISAHTEAADKIKGFEVGGTDYITRPFHVEEVLVRVQHQLALQDQRKLLREQNAEITRLHKKQIDYLGQINQLKDEFIQTVSHDLKSPISLIVGYVDMLIERDLVKGEEGLEFLEQIRQGAEQMHALVVNLLDLAQLEQGQAITPAPIDLGHFVANSVILYEMAALDKGIDFQLILHDEDQTVEIDPTRFEQVIHNLLSNAVKFTPAGGRIRVCSRIEADNFIIIVEDTGLGIAEEDLPKLFNKFFRARHHRKANKSSEGTGLGLAIARAVVEQHHGTIDVTSEVDAGTRFVVTIPTQQPAHTAAIE